ncbi:MAG: ATP-binding cassette domain-containing protein [Bacilli bacterium]
MEEFIRENPDKDPLVKFRDVRVGFKRGIDYRSVIENLNLDIFRGEILGLVGESGSGKTTIGRSINRVYPTSGGDILYRNVKINGKIPRDRERNMKKYIQMIFQDPSASLNERANIDYVISEGLRAFHLYKDEAERVEKVCNMMNRVGLPPEFLKRYPHEFSGGQRQRIGVARCMVMEPEFVIADEPISALDVSIRAQVLNLIKEFQISDQLTVLFIAHDLSVVRYISDRIAVINNGKIVELCEADRLFEMPLHPYTKALLTAVPLPDPQLEANKQIIIYNPLMHRYTKDDPADLYEVEPNHFVRANAAELATYLEIIQKEGGKTDGQKRVSKSSQ